MTVHSSLLPKYSYQDYINWKDDWELIGGYPYSLMPAPAIKHATVAGNAYFQAKLFLMSKDECNCATFYEIDWKINDETVVRPDVVIVCTEPKTSVLESPPILILEVLSPSTKAKDRKLKFGLYQEQGVKYYLMADYEKRSVEVFELINNVYQNVKKDTFKLDDDCEIFFNYNKFWDEGKFKN